MVTYGGLVNEKNLREEWNNKEGLDCNWYETFEREESESLQVYDRVKGREKGNATIYFRVS